MAIDNLVQHHYFRPNRGATGELDASSTYYFPYIHQTLSGNLLVVRLTYPYSAGRTVSVTDDASNTYTLAKKQDDTSNLFTVAYYACPGATAGAKKVTVTFDSDIWGVGCALTELSGMATSSVVDSSTGTASAADPNVAAGSFTPTNSNCIVMQTGVMTNCNTFYGINKCTGIAAGSGFELLSSSRETLIVDQWKLHSSGAVNPTFGATITVASTGQPWLTAAVAFKTSSGAGTPRPSSSDGTIRILKATHTVTAPAGLESTADAFEFPGQGSFVAVVTCFTNGQASFNSASDTTGGGSWTIPSHSTDMGQIAYSWNRTEDNARKVTITLSSAYAMNICLLDIAGIKASGDPQVGSKSEATNLQTVAHQAINALPSRAPSKAGNLLLASENNGHGPIGALTSPSGAVLLNSHYLKHTDSSSCDDSGDAYGYAIASGTGAHSFNWTDAVPDLSVTSITRSGSTATVTIAAGNDRLVLALWSNGDIITMNGAAQSEYNITAAISNLNTVAGTFDYPVSGTPATPATGGPITATQTTNSNGVVWEFLPIQPPTMGYIDPPAKGSRTRPAPFKPGLAR